MVNRDAEIRVMTKMALKELDDLLTYLESKEKDGVVEKKIVEMVESIEDIVECIELATDAEFMEELHARLQEVRQKDGDKNKEPQI